MVRGNSNDIFVFWWWKLSMQTLHSAKTDIVENLRNHFYYISYMIIVYCEYSYEIFFANNSYPMFEERKSKMAFTMKGGGRLACH